MTDLIRRKQAGEAWETAVDTGGGGSQTLAQVLATGGDPAGNPITGAVTISPSDLADVNTFAELVITPVVTDGLYHASPGLAIGRSGVDNATGWDYPGASGSAFADITLSGYSYDAGDLFYPTVALISRRLSDGLIKGAGFLNASSMFLEELNPQTQLISVDINYGFYAYGAGAANIELYADYDATTRAFTVKSSGGIPKVGFYTTDAIVKQTGVAVSAAGIHAALVNLGLIGA